MRFFKAPFHLAMALLLVLSVLTACGGGGGATANSVSTVATPTAAASQAAASPAMSPSTSPATTPTAPATPITPTAGTPPPTQLTVRASADLAGGVGPRVQVRIDGGAVGEFEVRSAVPQDHVLNITGLRAGAIVEFAFVNNALVGKEDRNLYVHYVTDGSVFMTPSQPGVLFDNGSGAAAFDGQDTKAGSEAIYVDGALRFTWPAATAYVATARELAASRFLQQAGFGAKRGDLVRFNDITPDSWIAEQMAMAPRADFLTYIQAKQDKGSDWLPPAGKQYTPDWLSQKFWADAASAPDVLRKRVAYALQSIFVISQVDGNLYYLARAQAQYLDNLNRLAFGNFRDLLEEVALSPAMGIYLSHLRNEKEDTASNRLPDENFARELMQLFTIGLNELNLDGTPKLDSAGQSIETYSNGDVMAMAKVFTGWSWGYDDNQLTDFNFRWATPDSATQGSARVDVRRMKPYPGQHSTVEMRLFAGKPHEVRIPALTSANDAARMALDALFKHANTGPFISRQLIQHLVTSDPSPAYVRRVASAFNDNGRGVRGDLGAVVRAILLDDEARRDPTAGFGKVREPVLRIGHWMRAFNARSASNEYQIGTEPLGVGQRVLHSPSVFGHFRPGYVPPAALLGGESRNAPEFQIVDESSTVHWINALELMLREGLGWHLGNRDITINLLAETALVAQAPEALLRHLDLLLFSGRMSIGLRKDIMDAMQGVPEGVGGRDLARAKVAVLVAMASPEYLIQR